MAAGYWLLAVKYWLLLLTANCYKPLVRIKKSVLYKLCQRKKAMKNNLKNPYLTSYQRKK